MAAGLKVGTIMGGAAGLIDVLDTRSFASVWYWLLLTTTWTWVSRGALGIPSELVRSLRRSGDDAPGGGSGRNDAAALELLDWVSLVAPRWHVSHRDGALLLALASFVLTILAGLGFLYGLEMAQAMLLLVAPLLLLACWRVRLARRLTATLAEAEAGRLSVAGAAADIARQVRVHLRATLVLSAVAVAAAAVWGTLWLATHPNGL